MGLVQSLPNWQQPSAASQGRQCRQLLMLRRKEVTGKVERVPFAAKASLIIPSRHHRCCDNGAGLFFPNWKAKGQRAITPPSFNDGTRKKPDLIHFPQSNSNSQFLGARRSLVRSAGPTSACQIFNSLHPNSSIPISHASLFPPRGFCCVFRRRQEPQRPDHRQSLQIGCSSLLADAL